MNTWNIMTCQGKGWTLSQILGDCSLSWFSIAIVIFAALILRRQCEDGFLSGMQYNVFGALAGGIIADVLIVTFTGSPRWGLLGGIVGLAVGGFLLGLVWDQAGGEE